MRMPNGYSIHKLTGKRNRPWRVRKTVGYVYVNKETGKEEIKPSEDHPTNYYMRQKYKNIGYFRTRTEAQEFMRTYTEEAEHPTATFGEIYGKWYDEKAIKWSKSRCDAIRSTYKVLDELENEDIANVNLNVMQSVIDRSGKAERTMQNMKAVFHGTMEYAFMHEYVPIERVQCTQYINFNAQTATNKREHIPFNSDEKSFIWSNRGGRIPDILLLLLYTGLRIGELIELKNEDVHLEERYFHVRHSKTPTGVRDVPICEKIVPLFEERRNETYVIGNHGNATTYKCIKYHHWDMWMDENKMKHEPHDTRHTFISDLTNIGIDKRVVQAIVGHKGNDITDVYTHIEMSVMKDAVNRL